MNLSEIDHLTFSVSLNPEDFRRYERFKRTDQQKLIRFAIVVGVMACTLLAMGVVAGVTGESVLGLVAGGIVSASLTYALRKQSKDRIERLSKEAVPYVLAFDRVGVTQKIGRAETKYLWSEVESVERGDDLIEVRTWEGAVYVVPRTSFENEEQFQLAFDFLNEQHKVVVSGHA